MPDLAEPPRVAQRPDSERPRRSITRPRGESAHFAGGGLFYYNRQNPAVFVESPVGPRCTLNLANKRAFVYVGYLLGLPVLMAWFFGLP